MPAREARRVPHEALLSGFPALRSGDLDEIREWLRPQFAVQRVDVPGRRRRFVVRINQCRLASMGLTYIDYGVPFVAELQQIDTFVQGLPLSGSGEANWNGESLEVRPALGGVFGGPGSIAKLAYDEDFTHLILNIHPAALTHRLSLLLDRPIDPPLRLTGRGSPAMFARQLRLLTFLAQEIEHSRNHLPDPVIAEIEDAIIVNYLLGSEHNYSRFLAGNGHSVAPWQVKRAVDYIEQHWDEPITIDLLTRITGTSARSLFQLFKRTHDVSPMVYLSQVRLRHAKDLLSRPDPRTSVTEIGFLCGFSNMGMFASKYYAAFGERPSETLRKSRR